MPHLTELLKSNAIIKLPDSSQSYYINFVIMDLRYNKTGGYLPRSHLIDPERLKPDAINALVDEFSKLKGVCHFVLMISTFNSSSFNIKSRMGSPVFKYKSFDDKAGEG